MPLPRPEYPRPQFVRPDWLCLNGEWEFEIDAGDSGLERGLVDRSLGRRINVPFCPESSLSGIGDTDFLRAVWYRRTVTVPDEWRGRRVLLHFGAVDYDATVWINGVESARHRGGFTPFTCPLKPEATGGSEIAIVVRARDFHQPPAALGKQSSKYAPWACFYTRTTGIWQTVWLEPVPAEAALKRPRITPDLAGGRFLIEQPITASRKGVTFHARVRDVRGTVAEGSISAHLDLCPRLELTIPEERRRAWSPADPHLYDIDLELRGADGRVIDKAASYAGLRGLAIDGNRFLINGEPVFQRLVLDQGYYPNGVMTAPTDEALRRDITLSMEAGFNGARLHQKVFEERFLYHADQLGYLVWGEFADWGSGEQGPRKDHQHPGITYVAQWLEALERDYSHPCIIGWCPLNETYQNLHDRTTILDDATRALFLAAKAMDRTRPVLDTSGYSHRVPESDIYDAHYYIEELDYAVGRKRFIQINGDGPQFVPFANPYPLRHSEEYGEDPTERVWSILYNGQPYFLSEVGGFKWNPRTQTGDEGGDPMQRKTSWGYGVGPKTLEQFTERFRMTIETLLGNPAMFGYCYTQLTDIYPEENGLYTFDRQPKFDIELLRGIQAQPAAYEEP